MIVNVADLKPEGSDKTYRELNAEMVHKFAVGDFVSYTSEEHLFPQTAEATDEPVLLERNLFVYEQTRDCDQTPLYTLSMNPPKVVEEHYNFLKQHYGVVDIAVRMMMSEGFITGVAEEDLKLVMRFSK